MRQRISFLCLLFCAQIALGAYDSDKCEAWFGGLNPPDIPENLPELVQVTFRTSPNGSSGEISTMFYEGPPVDLSKVDLQGEDYLRLAMKAGSIEVVQNGPITAIVSRIGTPHVSLERMLPRGARLLGGTRFHVQNGNWSEVVNSQHFHSIDGVHVHRKYFRFELEK